MKTARLVAMLVTVKCPTCDAEIVNPATDSYDWEPTHITPGSTHTCEVCGNRFAMPKTITLR